MTSNADTAALSAAQQRVWFMDQYVADPVNTIACELRLSGPLDSQLVQRAFGAVLAELRVLRTVLVTEGDRVVPKEAPATELLVLDLSELSAADRADRLVRIRRAEVGHGFELGAQPPLRATLVRSSPQEHLLLLTAHRAIADEASLYLLAADVGAAYRALRLGTPVAASGGGFPAFADAEAARRSSPGVEQKLAERRKPLADLPPLELPTDRVRPSQAGYLGGTVRQQLSRHLDDAVAEQASRLGVAPELLLQAGFQALLHRYSGQHRLALGSIGGRREADQARLIGPVDTWRVMVSEVAEKTTFADLVAAELAARQQPVLPFEWLIDAVQPARDLSRSPIFQAAFRFVAPPQEPDFGAAQLTARSLLPNPAALLDLELLVEPGPAEHWLTVSYRTDLFDPATADRMLEHFELLLAGGLAAPDTEVLSLPLIGIDERLRIELDFNRTDAPYPSDATVAELFEAQVLRTPDARAITMEGEHLRYRELNEQVNRLAHHLRAQGVGRGTLVGLCLQRSFELMISLLAVVKAGGAYVPLDPAYPADRLTFMVADTAVRVLITDERFAHAVDLVAGGTTIVLDRAADREAIAARPAGNPPIVNSPQDLCYIVYTSGSTGRPKGVMTSHRAIARLVINTDILQLDGETSYLQISPLSFDACSLEIYGPLLNGGRVVLLEPGVPTPARIAQTVREQGVDTLWLVAPLAAVTIDTHLDDLRGLRQFMAGGDVLSIPHVRRVLTELPEVSMVNGYGPTEVTAFSTSHKITYLDPDWPSVPIGRPIHNTTAYILDERRQLVPIGVWGELYQGGPGVANGYLNRPELNAERFIEDWFRPGAEAMLYRTGDRCRWLPGGLIQFQGRLDTQVKIDGLRVELGEVQSLIAADPAVGAAVVTAPLVNGRRSMVAYVVPSGPDFDPPAVRGRLRSQLPSVMVPAHFVALTEIPLTPNNKVDFARLPAPDLAGSAARRAASNPTQVELARIWAELLGVDEVGEQDSFFELGGHSLRAIPVIAAISTTFGVDLTVQDIFEMPTLEALAERIEARMLTAIDPEELAALLAEDD